MPWGAPAVTAAADPLPSDISIDEEAPRPPRGPARAAEALPRRFGPFELIRLIGRGGMAEVYDAIRLGAMGLHTRAAVKVLHANLCTDPRFLHLFVREAELTSQISHPNILQIHEFNRVGERFFIAMEYVDGCDLGRLLAHLNATDQRLPARVVIEIASQVLKGLGWAHRARSHQGRALNLVHRDLKPANVILSRAGLVKVADFGVAQSSASMYVASTEEDVKGTLTYMSPEQVGLKTLTHVSDLFSAGLILFEMLTGEALIPRGPIRQVVAALLRFDLEGALARIPGDRQAFRPVLESALQPEPAWRYGSAQEMADDLHALWALVPDAPCLERYLGPLCDDVALSQDDYDSRPTPAGEDGLTELTPEDLIAFASPPSALKLVRSP